MNLENEEIIFVSIVVVHAIKDNSKKPEQGMAVLIYFIQHTCVFVSLQSKGHHRSQ